MYLFISFIVIFINWIDAQKELSLNIKHAILTNIRTQFNFPDHLTNADIKRFVETVVQSSEGWEAPSNGTNYIMACNSAWNSTDGIDGCKTALSQKVKIVFVAFQ